MAGKYTKNIYIQRPIEFYQNLDFGKQIPIPSGNPDFIGSFHSELEMQFEAYMHKCWGGGEESTTWKVHAIQLK
jgi:hypothetical protein